MTRRRADGQQVVELALAGLHGDRGSHGVDRCG